jgi:hypothetical protein
MPSRSTLISWLLYAMTDRHAMSSLANEAQERFRQIVQMVQFWDNDLLAAFSHQDGMTATTLHSPGFA